MATDALLTLQAQPTTKTATFSGGGVDTGGVQATPPVAGAPLAPLWVRVVYSAAANASGSNTVTFTVDQSTDNVTWLTAAGGRVGDVVTLSTTPQSGEIFIPIVARARFIRLTATFAGAGSTPTISYGAELAPGAP